MRPLAFNGYQSDESESITGKKRTYGWIWSVDLFRALVVLPMSEGTKGELGSNDEWVIAGYSDLKSAGF